VNLDIQYADWAGFEAVMGEKGGCGGCWCMLWRLPKKVMDSQTGAGNKAAMWAIFETGNRPDFIARHDGIPTVCMHLDRRIAFPRLESSRVLRPADRQLGQSCAGD